MNKKSLIIQALKYMLFVEHRPITDCQGHASKKRDANYKAGRTTRITQNLFVIATITTSRMIDRSSLMPL